MKMGPVRVPDCDTYPAWTTKIPSLTERQNDLSMPELSKRLYGASRESIRREAVSLLVLKLEPGDEVLLPAPFIVVLPEGGGEIPALGGKLLVGCRAQVDRRRRRMTPGKFLGTHVWTKHVCPNLVVGPVNKVHRERWPQPRGELGGAQCAAGLSIVRPVRPGGRPGRDCVIGLRETRTTGFRAGEMRTDTLLDLEWSHGPSTEWPSGCKTVRL